MNSEKSMFSKLIETAKAYAERAYAPYSHFPVGSAVLTSSEQVYGGCNVENVSYGATICAERNAITTAIAEGHTNIRALAIYTPTPTFTPPCGMCLQVMSEFMEKNSKIILINANETKILKLEDLMPSPFEKEHLIKKK